MNKSHVYSSLKIIHDLDRIKQMREGKLVPPKTMRIDLNTICNHGCSFCLYQSSRDGLKGVGLNKEMPFGIQINDKRLIELIKEFK
jgi:MoaA/NifB/PqqE/SkfB family radical SAM enzyme